MKIDRTELKKFRTEFAAAVAHLETEFGIKIEIGNISFNDEEFHTKMTVKNVVNADGSEVDIEKNEFEKNCRFYGFDKDDYLREVKLYGHSETYILYGFNPNASKNTIRIREKFSGKQYVCPKLMIAGVA